MSALLLTARLALAAVFAVAGAAKLADRAGSRAALEAFGVPAALARPGARLLPLAEIAVAALLLIDGAARWGALGALVLLLGFVGGISRSMARGEAPDCHCFGQLHSEPAGWSTLVRNALLAAIAGFVALAGWNDIGASTTDWTRDLSDVATVALIGGVAIVAILSIGGSLFVRLLRRHGQTLLRLDAMQAALDEHGIDIADPDAPATGAPAPDFALAGLHGETITRDALLARQRPLVLVFTDPHCGPCSALMPELAGWQRDRDDLTIALVSRGSVDDNLAKVREHGLTDLYLQNDREVSEAYDGVATPTAVLVAPDGTIASAPAPGADAIRSLVAGGASRPEMPTVVHAGGPAPVRPPVAAIGDPAPDVRLRDLDGNETSLAEETRERTVVVFWDPACGFCERMVPQLREWEANPPRDAPDLLLVSTGSVADNRAMGIEAEILIDGNFVAGSAVGAGGTPTAVLVDQGRVASRLMAGAPDVLKLLGAADRVST
jgi:peroxiredoxin